MNNTSSEQEASGTTEHEIQGEVEPLSQAGGAEFERQLGGGRVSGEVVYWLAWEMKNLIKHRTGYGGRSLCQLQLYVQWDDHCRYADVLQHGENSASIEIAPCGNERRGRVGRC